MHWWQWAIYVLLLVVVLHEFDSGFRVTLRGNVTVKQLEGKRNHDILIVQVDFRPRLRDAVRPGYQRDLGTVLH
jgi:hypothetical protein